MSSLTFSVIYVCSEPEENSVDMSDVTGENELIASLKLYPPVSFIKELCFKHCKCLGMQYRLKETIVLRVLNQDFHFYILILEFKLNIQHSRERKFSKPIYLHFRLQSHNLSVM